MIRVSLSSSMYLENVTEEERAKIEEDLTLTNPAYVSAKRYTNYKNLKIPENLYYYVPLEKGLVVPRGYNLKFKHKIVNDARKEVTVPYPHFKLKLRDTQKDAVKHYLDNPDNGLIVLPTGKGKSILGLYLAYTLRQKTLILVHKDDLVDGWTKDSKLCFGEDLEVGLYKAKKRKIGAQITIATIQTLNRLSSEELNAFQENFGMVIVDETHHISSSSFNLLHKFKACYKIGLSATPERSDGLTKVMNFHLGGCAFKYEADETDEDILPVKVLVKTLKNVDTPIYCMPKKNNRGKTTYVLAPPEYRGPVIPITDIFYKQRPRVPYTLVDDMVVTNKHYMNTVIKDIMNEYHKDRSIICFFSQKEHVRKYAEMLRRHGVPKKKILLYYGDSKESKDTMKQRAESKEALITLATYSIATEGTNVRAWEVAFLVSSINNEKNTEQAVGRIRRVKGKDKLSTVLVYDYVLPNTYSIGTKHYYTRKRRYMKLGFPIINRDMPTSNRNITSSRRGLFTRGFGI